MQPIVVNKSEMTKLGNQMLHENQNFADDIKKFTSIIESINTVWEGADALKYINIMHNKCLKNMEELQDVLEKYGSYLAKAGDPYEKLDEVFASKKISV